MNRFKYQAMFSEFPILRRILTRNDGLVDARQVDDIRVRRLDVETLQLIPEEWTKTGSLVDVWRNDKWYMVISDLYNGECEEFAHPSFDFQSNYAYEESYERPGETILESLDRLGGRTFLYLVRIVEEHNYIEGHSREHSLTVTIYKPKANISAAIEEARQRAAINVAAEVANI